MAREFDFSDLEDIEQKPKGKFDLTREFYERARRSDDPLGYDDYQEVKDRFGMYAPIVAQGAKTGDALLRGIMGLGYGASGLAGDITGNELLARDLAGMFESAGGRLGSPGSVLTAPYRAGTTLSKAKVKQVADDVASDIKYAPEIIKGEASSVALGAKQPPLTSAGAKAVESSSGVQKYFKKLYPNTKWEDLTKNQRKAVKIGYERFTKRKAILEERKGTNFEAAPKSKQPLEEGQNVYDLQTSRVVTKGQQEAAQKIYKVDFKDLDRNQKSYIMNPKFNILDEQHNYIATGGIGQGKGAVLKIKPNKKHEKISEELFGSSYDNLSYNNQYQVRNLSNKDAPGLFFDNMTIGDKFYYSNFRKNFSDNLKKDLLKETEKAINKTGEVLTKTELYNFAKTKHPDLSKTAFIRMLDEMEDVPTIIRKGNRKKYDISKLDEPNDPKLEEMWLKYKEYFPKKFRKNPKTGEMEEATTLFRAHQIDQRFYNDPKNFVIPKDPDMLLEFRRYSSLTTQKGNNLQKGLDMQLQTANKNFVAARNKQIRLQNKFDEATGVQKDRIRNNLDRANEEVKVFQKEMIDIGQDLTDARLLAKTYDPFKNIIIEHGMRPESMSKLRSMKDGGRVGYKEGGSVKPKINPKDYIVNYSDGTKLYKINSFIRDVANQVD